MNNEIVVTLPYINQPIRYESSQQVQLQDDYVLCPMCEIWHHNNTFCQANL